MEKTLHTKREYKERNKEAGGTTTDSVL